MNNIPLEEFKKEIDRRNNIILNHITEISHIEAGIMTDVNYYALLALMGYPFKNPYHWMDEQYKKPIINHDTYKSNNNEYMQYVNKQRSNIITTYLKIHPEYPILP